jgi:uncharacterized protein with beta-barrel porin domain
VLAFLWFYTGARQLILFFQTNSCENEQKNSVSLLERPGKPSVISIPKSVEDKVGKIVPTEKTTTTPKPQPTPAQPVKNGGAVAVNGVSNSALGNGGASGDGTSNKASPILNVGGASITAGPSGAFVVAGQTLAPGSTAVVSGTTYSLVPGGSVAVINGNTSTLAVAGSVGGAVHNGIGGYTGPLATGAGTEMRLLGGGFAVCAVGALALLL